MYKLNQFVKSIPQFVANLKATKICVASEPLSWGFNASYEQRTSNNIVVYPFGDKKSNLSEFFTLYFMDKKLSVFSVSDLYKQVKDILLEKQPINSKYMMPILYCRGTMIHGHDDLRMFNIHNNDTIKYQFYPLVGGSEKTIINIETSLKQNNKTPRAYSHVKECEWELVYAEVGDKEKNKKHLNKQSFDKITDILKTVLSDKFDTEVKLIEDLMLLIFGIQKANTKTDVLIAIATFTKLRMVTPMSTTMLRNCISFAVDTYLINQTQSADNFFQAYREIASSLVDNYSMVKNSPLVKKLHLFSTVVLGASIFDQIGMKVTNADMNRLTNSLDSKMAMGAMDFTHLIIETVTFIVERGYQCVTMKSFQPLFHSGKTHELWYSEAQLLKERSNFLGNPEVHGFSEYEFRNELDTCIEKGESIVQFLATLGPMEKRYGSQLLGELRMIRATTMTKNDASKDRIEPMGIMIYGGSSVMKSAFATELYYQYAKTMNLPCDEEYRYVRNHNDPFWSGFKSSKVCVHMDDAAPYKPNAMMGVDPSVAELLQILNSVAFVTTQAELCDKGKIPFRARLVTVSTNTVDLNAFHYYNNELAIRRRLPLVVMLSPKPEYAKGPMIDSSKVPHLEPGDYHDVWIIKVFKPVPQGNPADVALQRAKLELIKEYDNIYEFMAFFSKVSKIQYDIQLKAKRENTYAGDIELCNNCYHPKKHCNCVQSATMLKAPQGAIVDLVAVTPRTFRIRLPHCNIIYSVPQETVGMWDGKYYYLHDVMALENPPSVIDNYLLNNSDELSEIIQEYFRVIQTHNVSWYSRVICMGVESVIQFILRYSFLRWMSMQLLNWDFLRSWILYLIYLISPTIQGVWYLLSLVAEKRFSRPSILVKIGFATSLLGATWLIQKKFRDVFSNSSEEKLPEKQMMVQHSRVPQPLDEEYTNVWCDHDKKTTQFQFSEASKSWSRYEWDDVKRMLRHNLVNVIIHFKVLQNGEMVAGYRQNKAVCLTSHVYLINRHAWIKDSELEFIFESQGGGVTSNIKVDSGCINMVEFPEYDLIMFEILSLPPRRNIINLFCEDNFSGRGEGMYLIRDMSGSVSTLQLDNIRVSDKTYVPQFDQEMAMAMAICERDTVNGECGSLMLCKAPGGICILGLHALGGHRNMVQAPFITKSFLESALKSFPMSRVQGGTPQLKIGRHELVMGPLHSKAHVNWEEGHAEVIGSNMGFRAKPKTSVQSSYVREAFEKRGYVLKHGAPDMKSWKPWHLALTEMVNTNNNVDIKCLKHCADNYVDQVVKHLPSDWKKMVHTMPEDVAINGVDGVAYIDAINKNTSAGAPINAGKRSVMTFDETTGKWSLTKELHEAVGRINDCYAKGERSVPIFKAHLKDEPVTFAKQESGKTRVFVGGPLAWVVAVRMHLLWFIRLAQNNRITFELGAGTVAQSVEWGHIYEYLCAFGQDRIVAGDFKSFDKKMGSAFILYAYYIIAQIAERAGSHTDEIRSIMAIGEDTAFSFVDFDGDLIMFFGTNPSGHPLTVIINSLVNSLYMRYAYAKANPNGTDCSDFQDNVHLYTYGDDNIMGVSKMTPWFNHTAIQKEMSNIGVTYTMADKEAISVPYINIADTSFLKRKWRFDNDVGSWLCPLDHESIEKMLLIQVKSKILTTKAQAIAGMSSALKEYFFYGKEEFTAKRTMFLEVVEEMNLRAYVESWDFPDWETILHSFHAASERYLRVRNARDNADKI